MFRFVTTNNSATDPTVGRLERVPEDALRLNFMQAVFLDRPMQPFEQTHPFTILSQTLVGSQVVRFADVEVSAAPGEIFVVPNNQQMRIEHHPDRAGRWAARWVHIHFTLFGTLDFLHHSERMLPVFTFVDEHMHESPMEYIKRVRLERSRQMLATTDVPVYAVAESVGFINPFHFSRAFKEASGMSPSHYRKQLQEEQAVVSP